MEAYPIYTIGGGTLLVDIFNGIAALMNGDQFEQMITITAMLGFLWIFISQAFNPSLVNGSKWFIGAIILYNSLLIPKITVQIEDKMDPLTVRVVDNVPLGIGLLASYSSQFGISIAESMEEVFSAPNDLSYTKSGFLFGADLMSAATKMRVPDPTMAINLNEFMTNCVLMELSYGRFSYEELMLSNNLINLFNEKGLSQLRSIQYLTKNTAGQTYEIKSCQESYNLITASLNSESYINSAVNWLFSNVDYIKTRTDSSCTTASRKAELFNSHLPLAYDFYANKSESALDIINQQVMLNAMNDAARNFDAAYLDARTELQIQSTYKTMGRQARESVPVLRVFFEAFLYGIFPFVFLLFLLPMGFSILKQYLLALVWIQSWFPIYAIIQRIASGYQQNSILNYSGQGGFNAINNYDISNVIDSVAATASYITIMTPYLALMVIRGISNMGHLATSMLAVPQQAAAEAAQEATTGNIRLGNSSINDHAYNNTSANKYDVSFGHDIGSQTMRQNSGSLITNTAGGNSVINDQSAISDLKEQLTVKTSHSELFRNSAQQIEEKARNQSFESIKSQSAAFDKIYDSNIFKNKIDASNENFNRSSLTRDESALSDVETAAEKLAAEHNMTKQTATALIMAAGLNSELSLAGKAAEKLLGFKGGVEASREGRSLSTDVISQLQDIVNSKEMRESISKVDEAIKSSSYDLRDEHGVSMNESVRSSMNEAESYSQSASELFSKSSSYHAYAESSIAKDLLVEQDLTQDFVKYVEKNYDINDLKDKSLKQHHIEEFKNTYLDSKEIDIAESDKLYNSVASSHMEQSNLGADSALNTTNYSKRYEAKVDEFANSNNHRDRFDNSHIVNEINQNIKNSEDLVSKKQIVNEDFKQELKEKSERESASVNFFRSNKTKKGVFDDNE